MTNTKPMASAPFVYDENGAVAWGQMWQSFCTLALDGGPPHRGDMLPPVDAAELVPATEEAYQQVVAEIIRGIAETTGLLAEAAAPGWIAVCCTTPTMAAWMAEAIVAEGVTAVQDGTQVLVPAGPTFQIAGEIKNVITAVAKTHHYWVSHRIDPDAQPPAPATPAIAAALDALRVWAVATERS